MIWYQVIAIFCFPHLVYSDPGSYNCFSILTSQVILQTLYFYVVNVFSEVASAVKEKNVNFSKDLRRVFKNILIPWQAKYISLVEN